MFLQLLLRMRLVVFLLTGLITLSYLPKKVAAQEDEKELFLIAQRAFDDGFYDVAIRYIEQFLQKYPQTEKRVQANLLLGQCYFFKNQYLKAFNIFQSLAGSSEFKDAILFWLGETYLKGSDYSQAEKQYKQVIELFPNSPYAPQAFYSLAWTHFEQKDYKRAQEHFKQLTKKFPLHQLTEDGFFKSGECEYNLRQYENAIEEFQNYIIKYPKSNRRDQAYFYIAESFYYLNEYSDAIDYYGKTVAISTDAKLTVMANVSLGWSYLKQKQFDAAQKAFLAAQQLADEKNILSDDIFLGEASLYTEMGEHAKALAAYSRLIQDFPKSPRLIEAFLGKANIQYLLKDYPASIETYQNLINKYAESADNKEIIEKAYFGLAWAFLKKGDIDAAISNFEHIKSQTENKTVKISALTQIGDAYQDAGKLDKALDIYDQILRDYPDSLYSDYVQYRQGIALLKMNKLDAAALSLQTLAANFPKSKLITDSKYYLGVAYFKKNDWPRAKELIENFLKEAPKNSDFLPEANYILALSFFNLNDPANAMKTFDKILKLYADDENLVHQCELGMAKSLYQLGDAKEAIKKFKLILYKYPQTETALNAMMWLGDYYLENSEFDNALEFYQQILTNFPHHKQIPLLHYKIGQAHQAKGNLDKAINAYKLIDDPKDKELYAKAKLAIAEIFSKEMDLDTAITTYRNIAANCPEMKRDALLKIAEANNLEHKYEESLQTLNEALRADPGLSELTNAELQFRIGDLEELLNKPDAAIENYLKVPYLYPKETTWVVKSYLRVARLFEDKEDWENAKSIYQKIIASGTDEVKFAQERLDWIQANTNKPQL